MAHTIRILAKLDLKPHLWWLFASTTKTRHMHCGDLGSLGGTVAPPRLRLNRFM